MCLRLRHAVRAAGIGTEECQCFVITFTATCLNGAACCAVSFAAPQTESRDAGLPEAKRRGADSRVAFSLGTYLLAKQKKVPRLAGRDPPSVLKQATEKQKSPKAKDLGAFHFKR